jgi:hypothetical protein
VRAVHLFTIEVTLDQTLETGTTRGSGSSSPYLYLFYENRLLICHVPKDTKGKSGLFSKSLSPQNPT